jgi:hypothetical protein
MRATTVALALVLAAGCGEDTIPKPPPTAVVSFLYVSQFPDECPNAHDIGCFALCGHNMAPLGLQVVLPSWGAHHLRLARDGPKRWQGTFFDVPVGVPLQVGVKDIDGCCFGTCQTFVFRDVFANGVLLTRVVQVDGSAALEFQVGPDGNVTP